MRAAEIFAVVFAAGAVLAALALAGAATRRLPRRALLAAVGVLGLAAAAAWVAFALDPVLELGLAAGGLTACVLAAAAGIPVRATADRFARADADVQAAHEGLRAVIEQATGESAVHLERVSARLRS